MDVPDLSEKMEARKLAFAASSLNMRKTMFALKTIFALFILYRVFLLDIFPMLTNDSLLYLYKGTSGFFFKNPIEIIQPRGFKFAGYPMYISVVQFLNFSPLDLMTALAFFQRFLLSAGLVWLIFDMGLVSIPVALFLSSGHIIAQSNLILTEGLTVPLGIFFSIAVVNVWRRSKEGGGGFWFYFVVAAAAFLMLVLVKINYAVYGLAFLPTAVILGSNGLWPKIRFKPAATVVIALFAVVFLYILVISFDNYRNFNQFTPVTGKERARYWGVWQQIFTEHPENKYNPELAEYYSSGNVYTIMHSVEKNCGGWQKFICTEPILRQKSDEMIDRANLSLWKERLRTSWRAVFGGGKVELEFTRNVILRQNGRADYDIEQMSKNPYIKNKGIQVFLNAVNGGEKPRILPGLSRSPLTAGNYRLYEAMLTVIALAAFCFLIVTGRAGLNTPYPYIVASYFTVIAGLSVYFVDIWRYIISPWTVFVIVIFYGVSDALNTVRFRDFLWGYRQ